MKISVAPNIASLVPYPPGKPIEELEREYGITGSIKLASNENPLGPSPRAIAAIEKALANLHRYPDGSCYYLAQRLAEKLGVAPANLVFGNGSNEIIELLVSTFLQPGEAVVTSHPTFLVYQKMVQAQGGENIVVPLRDMRHDLDRLAAAITDRTRLIFLDNPNNPTGTIFDPASFDRFLDQVPESVIVVVDEAYIDFVEPKLRLDIRRYLDGDRPVVSLRTFSKAYGLAGLRIGYGIMPAAVADYVHRVRQPFNVNQLAQVGALAALDDDEHHQKTLTLTRQGMAELADGVRRLGCTPYPSHTNFFLVDVKRDAKDVYERMLRKGVIIRAMTAYGYPEFIRITVGLPEENARCLAALEQTLTECQPNRPS